MIKSEQWLKYAKKLCIKDILKVTIKYVIMVVIVAYACIGIMTENVFYVAYNTTFTSCFCIAAFLILIAVLGKYTYRYLNKFYKNWRKKNV